MDDQKELSFLVLVSFILLFFVFVFTVSPSAEESKIEPTGYVTLAGFSFDFSNFYLILISVLLLILLAVVFIIYKKVKNRKKIIVQEPIIKQEEANQIGFVKNDGRFVKGATLTDEKAIEEDKKLSNKDIDELFSIDEKKQEEQVKEGPIQVEQNNSGFVKGAKPLQEVKIDLMPLKNTILSLLKQDHSKQQILVYLNSKGWKTENIKQALELINEDNLRDYIKKALSQGFKKEQIIEALTTKGWNKEKVLKQLE